jgi:hypothetical protein
MGDGGGGVVEDCEAHVLKEWMTSIVVGLMEEREKKVKKR